MSRGGAAVGRKMLISKLSGAVGLHSESILGMPVLELCGDDRILVENIRQVISFDENQIYVSVEFGFLCLEGECLLLDYLGENRILVKGKIATITVQRNGSAK